MKKNVTVTRARRVLGKLALALTDDQVKEMLDTMYQLAGENLLYNGSKESDNSNESITTS